MNLKEVSLRLKGWILEEIEDAKGAHRFEVHFKQDDMESRLGGKEAFSSREDAIEYGNKMLPDNTSAWWVIERDESGNVVDESINKLNESEDANKPTRVEPETVEPALTQMQKEVAKRDEKVKAIIAKRMEASKKAADETKADDHCELPKAHEQLCKGRKEVGELVESLKSKGMRFFVKRVNEGDCRYKVFYSPESNAKEAKVLKSWKDTINEAEEPKGAKRDANELFSEFLDLVEFGLVKYAGEGRKSSSSWDGEEYEGEWGLKDYQGANLADIEAERFSSAAEIVDRLDTYVHDYMLSDEEWGEFDSVEDALEKAPNHPLKDLLDLIAHRIDEVDLDKVPHEVANDQYKGSECFALHYIGSDGKEIKTLGKPYALNCEKALADKLVATMNKYPGRTGMRHEVERLPYCDAQNYKVLSRDDVEEWIMKIEAEGKAALGESESKSRGNARRNAKRGAIKEAPDKDGIETDDELDAEEKKARDELEARLKARRDQVAKKRADRDAEEARKDALKAKAKGKLDEIGDDWSFGHLFDVLVPESGKCESLAGEIVRAINKIEYRWHNDGDKFNEGYGIETCGQPACFLANVEVDEETPFWDLILNVDTEGDDDRYEETIGKLKDKAEDFIKDHTELLSTETDDMYDIEMSYVNEFLQSNGLIPEYFGQCEIPAEIASHIEAGNITLSDVRYAVENWLDDNRQSRGFVSYIDDSSVELEGLDSDGLESLNDNDLYRWLNEYAEELTNEYGEPGEDEEPEDEVDESCAHEADEGKRKFAKKVVPPGVQMDDDDMDTPVQFNEAEAHAMIGDKPLVEDAKSQIEMANNFSSAAIDEEEAKTLEDDDNI